MRKAGVPEGVIMKITEHSTREMFDRYDKIDAEDKKEAVDQLEVFLWNVDPFVGLNKKGTQAIWPKSLFLLVPKARLELAQAYAH